MTTAFLSDADFLEHDTGPGHPERSDRLVAALNHLENQPWFSCLTQVSPTPIDERWIAEIHARDYISRADAACRSGQAFLDTPDVSISRRSAEIARLAAGSGIVIADQLMNETIDNGFALVRPPGHHAETQAALGFCLFNNIAILARYLQKQHGLEKVLIVDWDVHHGNGTQHTFEADPSVLYISLHQYPYYPGTGSVSETGIGRGNGATLNCPMPAGAEDSDYQAAFSSQVLPKINAFKPDIVLVSAGFDAHRSDPLAQICLTTKVYRWMTIRLMEIAEQFAGGKLISLLEGGYDLNALAHCVATHVQTLSGIESV